MAAKLFVGGISWDTTEDSLKTFFEQAGKVVSATIISDKFSGKSKGFGFVEMSSEEEAKEAINKLNGQTLDGRTITVNEAKPQVPRESYSGPSSGGKRDFGQRGRGRRDSRGRR